MPTPKNQLILQQADLLALLEFYALATDGMAIAITNLKRAQMAEDTASSLAELLYSNPDGEVIDVRTRGKVDAAALREEFDAKVRGDYPGVDSTRDSVWLAGAWSGFLFGKGVA